MRTPGTQRSSNPNGIVSSSPGLRGTSYPGSRTEWCATPTGLWPVGTGGAEGPQPRWGCGVIARFPRVARASQPWAGGRNPVGIQRWDFRKNSGVKVRFFLRGFGFGEMVCDRKVCPPSPRPSPRGRGRHARPRQGNLSVLRTLTALLAFAPSRARCRKPFAFAERGERFSLSPGERAGVRAGVTPTTDGQRNHSQSFQRNNLLSSHRSSAGFSVFA